MFKSIDVTQNKIRIRVENPSKFIKETFRTIKITNDITSVVGKLKSDSEDVMKNQKFMFNRENYTVPEARKWVMDHGYKIKSMGGDDENTFLEFGDFILLDPNTMPKIGETIRFNKYLSTFNGKDRSGDTVMESAFNEHLNKKFPLLINHDNHTKSQCGSIITGKDEIGLLCSCSFLVTSENIHEAMMLKTGHLNKCSMGGRFSYKMNQDGTFFKDQYDRYVIERVELFEGSLIPCPDNMDAEVDTESIYTEIFDDNNIEENSEYEPEKSIVITDEKQEVILDKKKQKLMETLNKTKKIFTERKDFKSNGY